MRRWKENVRWNSESKFNSNQPAVITSIGYLDRISPTEIQIKPTHLALIRSIWGLSFLIGHCVSTNSLLLHLIKRGQISEAANKRDTPFLGLSYLNDMTTTLHFTSLLLLLRTANAHICFIYLDRVGNHIHKSKTYAVTSDSELKLGERFFVVCGLWIVTRE